MKIHPATKKRINTLVASAIAALKDFHEREPTEGELEMVGRTYVEAGKALIAKARKKSERQRHGEQELEFDEVSNG